MGSNKLSCDLLIIGAGMAGNAAALFAVEHGIDTIQAGQTSEIGFASGLIDLLGVHPAAEGKVLHDPWQGIAQLRQDEPLHPYAKLSNEVIRAALEKILKFFGQNGYPYEAALEKNTLILTPTGTIKPTYAVPHTMAHGARALAAKTPCLLVDFKRLRGFSGRQIVLSLTARWPNLRTTRLRFPEQPEGELYPERMARAMESSEVRAQIIAAIKPHLGDARAVALPAVMGVYHTVQILKELQQGLGVPVFEIPTMLPAVTGLRLQEIFEQHLPAAGVRSLRQQRVLAAVRQGDGRWALTVGDETGAQQVIARAVVLCSGRFFGKGLHADRQGIRETIFNLPVVQPADRAAWHHKDLLHTGGHPINRAGLAVDQQFRPVDGHGRLIHANLFAAGSILAYQDWVRQKCGSGLAIASAYAAVEEVKRSFKFKV
ncbi:MAG: glycerol-3-phosphate dehydrogenase subunit GlpB [Desulfobacteraceae bacterium]|nr:glycerol-3-phosphate dehydrogenase subunit GlpB [Desulfobacteraceae bacterium]